VETHYEVRVTCRVSAPAIFVRYFYRRSAVCQ
jgi:hypothetical protein